MTTATMNRQTLHHLVDVVDGDELETIYKVLVRFVPESVPEDDEVAAIAIAQREIANGEVVSHGEINWNG